MQRNEVDAFFDNNREVVLGELLVIQLLTVHLW